MGPLSVDLADALEGAGVDDEVGEGVEMAERAEVADLGPLDAQLLGLAVDALGTGALVVEPVEGRARAVQRDSDLAPGFQVDHPTAAPLRELGVGAGLAGPGRMEQGTDEALGRVAIFVGEACGR